MKVSNAYQWKRKSRNWKFKKSKAFIDYSQTIDDVCRYLEDYNPATKRIRALIVFDDMIADMESNKKLSLIVTELVLRRRKLNTSIFLFHSRVSKYLKS